MTSSSFLGGIATGFMTSLQRGVLVGVRVSFHDEVWRARRSASVQPVYRSGEVLRERVSTRQVLSPLTTGCRQTGLRGRELEDPHGPERRWIQGSSS